MNQADGPASQNNTSQSVDVPPTGTSQRQAIVAGFGLAGRMTAEQLEQADMQVTIIELNLLTIERQLGLERRIVYGDVTEADVLRQAGIEQASALILAIPDEAAAVQACKLARQLNPHVFIAARTSFFSQGLLATQAGADHVVVEEIVTAEAMRQAVLDRLVQ